MSISTIREARDEDYVAVAKILAHWITHPTWDADRMRHYRGVARDPQALGELIVDASAQALLDGADLDQPGEHLEPFLGERAWRSRMLLAAHVIQHAGPNPHP